MDFALGNQGPWKIAQEWRDIVPWTTKCDDLESLSLHQRQNISFTVMARPGRWINCFYGIMYLAGLKYPTT